MKNKFVTINAIISIVFSMLLYRVGYAFQLNSSFSFRNLFFLIVEIGLLLTYILICIKKLNSNEIHYCNSHFAMVFFTSFSLLASLCCVYMLFFYVGFSILLIPFLGMSANALELAEGFTLSATIITILIIILLIVSIVLAIYFSKRFKKYKNLLKKNMVTNTVTNI